METRSSRTGRSHTDIANRLFVRLAAVLVGAGLVNSFVAAPGPLGPGAFAFLLAVNLVALWLSVHVVFDALDDLLETKLERIEGSE